MPWMALQNPNDKKIHLFKFNNEQGISHKEIFILYMLFRQAENQKID